MTSKVILWLNNYFESCVLPADLNHRLKQIAELGFENIVLNAPLALKIFQDKNNLNGLLVKAIVYSDPIEMETVQTYIGCHHEFNCPLAIISEEVHCEVKSKFELMGVNMDSDFCTLSSTEETTHKSRLIIKSPLSMNPQPMQAAVVKETKEEQLLIDKFMRLKGNNFLLVCYPDLVMIDFLKQSKDTLNRLFFLQTR